MVIGFIYVCSQFLPSDSPWFPAWTWQILSLNPRILILELRILGPNKTHCEDAWHIFSMSLFPKFQVFTWSKKSTYFIKNVNYDVWFTAGSNLFLGFVPTFYLVPSVLSVAKRHWRPQKDHLACRSIPGMHWWHCGDRDAKVGFLSLHPCVVVFFAWRLKQHQSLTGPTLPPFNARAAQGNLPYHIGGAMSGRHAWCMFRS